LPCGHSHTEMKRYRECIFRPGSTRYWLGWGLVQLKEWASPRSPSSFSKGMSGELDCKLCLRRLPLKSHNMSKVACSVHSLIETHKSASSSVLNYKVFEMFDAKHVETAKCDRIDGMRSL
jgi:hypothetical protein